MICPTIPWSSNIKNNIPSPCSCDEQMKESKFCSSHSPTINATLLWHTAAGDEAIFLSEARCLERNIIIIIMVSGQEDQQPLWQPLGSTLFLLTKISVSTLVLKSCWTRLSTFIKSVWNNTVRKHEAKCLSCAFGSPPAGQFHQGRPGSICVTCYRVENV